MANIDNILTLENILSYIAAQFPIGDEFELVYSGHIRYSIWPDLGRTYPDTIITANHDSFLPGGELYMADNKTIAEWILSLCSNESEENELIAALEQQLPVAEQQLAEQLQQQ